MRTIRKAIVIEAARGAVFDLVDDPGCYPEFFVGITKWEPRSKKRRGVGAKYRVLMQVGSIEAGGTVRVTERTVNRAIAWTWEQGFTRRAAGRSRMPVAEPSCRWRCATT